MKICGVDDAGRGSMIGPMVIAGISIEKKISINFVNLVLVIQKNSVPKNVIFSIKKF